MIVRKHSLTVAGPKMSSSDSRKREIGVIGTAVRLVVASVFIAAGTWQRLDPVAAQEKVTEKR